MNGTQDSSGAQGRWTVEDGAALKAWRVGRGMSQVEAGARLGVSGRTISGWERALTHPLPHHLGAARALIGGEGVEASAQLTLAPRAHAHTVKVVEEEAAPSARDPYRMLIDWRAFAYRGRDASGISLRAMVDAGLYSAMHKAVEALGEDFSPIRVKTPSTGGRPGDDYVLTLRDAQRFAMRARTEVGHQIAELILDHHDEFQRLLDGDVDARARLAEVQPTATAPTLTDDPILNALTIAIESRRAQLVLEQQVREQGARLELMESRVQRVRGESNLYQLAHRAGWMSTVSVERGDPKPHIVAVLAALRAAGLDSPARGVRQHMIPGEEGASVYAIGGEALERWPELVEYYGDGRFAVVCPETGRTYRVTRIKREEA